MYAADGAAKGEIDLDPAIFGIEPNVPVMHQVVNAQLAAARSGSHSTKTRSEVRGGGRKPWRQKGLGRARHGSIRSPQWVGGGVAHGPKPRDYTRRVNRKMRRLALNSSLSVRAADRKVKVAEDFDWSEPKTKNAQGSSPNPAPLTRCWLCCRQPIVRPSCRFATCRGSESTASTNWPPTTSFGPTRSSSPLRPSASARRRLVRRHGQRLRPRRERRSRDERG